MSLPMAVEKVVSYTRRPTLINRIPPEVKYQALPATPPGESEDPLGFNARRRTRVSVAKRGTLRASQDSLDGDSGEEFPEKDYDELDGEEKENRRRTVIAKWTNAFSMVSMGGSNTKADVERKKIARRVKALKNCERHTLASRISMRLSKNGEVVKEKQADGTVVIRELGRKQMDVFELVALTAVHIPFFSNLPLMVQKQLIKAAVLRQFSRGDYICKQGTPGDNFYCVINGHIGVLASGLEVARLEMGQTFGEMALISGANRAASCVAVDDVDLLVVDKDTFLAVFKDKFSVLHGECVSFLQQHVRAFRDCSHDVCTEFAHHLSQVYFPAFFRFLLDDSSMLYFIKSGECSVCAAKDGKEALRKEGDYKTVPLVRITSLGVGNFFGEHSVFKTKTMGWVVQAETEVVLYQMPSNLYTEHVTETVRRLMQDESTFRINYYAGRVSTGLQATPTFLDLPVSRGGMGSSLGRGHSPTSPTGHGTGTEGFLDRNGLIKDTKRSSTPLRRVLTSAGDGSQLPGAGPPPGLRLERSEPILSSSGGDHGHLTDREKMMQQYLDTKPSKKTKKILETMTSEGTGFQPVLREAYTDVETLVDVVARARGSQPTTPGTAGKGERRREGFLPALGDMSSRGSAGGSGEASEGDLGGRGLRSRRRRTSTIDRLRARSQLLRSVQRGEGTWDDVDTLDLPNVASLEDPLD